MRELVKVDLAVVVLVELPRERRHHRRLDALDPDHLEEPAELVDGDGAVAVDVELLEGLADVAVEAVDGVDRRRRLDRVGVEEGLQHAGAPHARHEEGGGLVEHEVRLVLGALLEQLLVAEPGHRAAVQRDVVLHHQTVPEVHREEHRRLPTLDVARRVHAEEVREHEERRGVVEHVAEERPPRELRAAGGRPSE